MAAIGAVNMVGESIVGLLRDRRDLLGADGLLGPVPPALDISQASVGRLVTQPPPTSGCTITCYHMAMSDHATPRVPGRDAARATTLALDLHYMLTSWSPVAEEEQAIVSWAMLELLAYPVLDRSLLRGANIWAADESVQIVPETFELDALLRIWSAMQLKYRLCATFCARVVRITHGQPFDWVPVVATRFAQSHGAVVEPV